MSQVVPGTTSLAYNGISQPNPPNIWVRERDPTSDDFRNYRIGDKWWSKVASSPSFWKLTNKVGPVATWENFAGSGTGDINTINSYNTPDTSLWWCVDPTLNYCSDAVSALQGRVSRAICSVAQGLAALGSRRISRLLGESSSIWAVM